MEFSNLFAGESVVLAPPFCVSWSTERVILRGHSLQVLQTHRLPHVHACAFAPSAQHLFVHAGSTVYVLSTQEERTLATIQVAGLEGCRAVQWMSDSCIGVFSDFKLRLTLWSLAEPTTRDGTTKPTAVIQRLKCAPSAGWGFHPDKRYLVLAERHEHRDCLGIYDALDDWKLVRVGGTPFADQPDQLAALRHRYQRPPQPCHLALRQLHCRLGERASGPFPSDSCSGP